VFARFCFQIAGELGPMLLYLYLGYERFLYSQNISYKSTNITSCAWDCHLTFGCYQGIAEITEMLEKREFHILSGHRLSLILSSNLVIKDIVSLRMSVIEVIAVIAFISLLCNMV